MAQRAENKPAFTERSALCAFTYELRRNNGMKNVKRGEIYYADLSPAVGSEQDGVRPVLILQNDTGNKFSSTTIIAPITSVPKKRSQPTHVFIDCDFLESESVILLEQLRTIDKKRLSDRLGQLSAKDMQRVESAMSVSLGMEQSQPEVRHE